jgi:hypothetical protein
MPLTPGISSDAVPKASGAAKKWMAIEVWFSWKPRLIKDKYSDDLVFNYYVLLSNRSATNPTGTLLSGQVIHSDIPANEPDLKSVMYISPRTLERFFDGRMPTSKETAIVDIGVTISKQGQVVASKSFKGSGNWWSLYKPTDGYLLNKTETPFAPLYWNYYEAAKKP